LPKRGFNNAAFKKEYAVVNLDDLNQFEAGSTINEQLLRESKHIRGRVAGLKILGRGELKHGLTIEADRVSQSAKEKIEKAGGTITLRSAAASKAKPSSEAIAAAEEKPAAKKKAAARKKKSAE
jgi:large subunit ribosomal protein L15